MGRERWAGGGQHRAPAWPDRERTGSARYDDPPMSTRKLIFAALLCGMAIIVAFTFQVLLIHH